MAEPIIGRRSELQALGRFVEHVPTGGRALLIERVLTFIAEVPASAA
jgi:hypothetical protein